MTGTDAGAVPESLPLALYDTVNRSRTVTSKEANGFSISPWFRESIDLAVMTAVPRALAVAAPVKGSIDNTSGLLENHLIEASLTDEAKAAVELSV